MGRYLSTSLEMILATFLYNFEHCRIFKNMFFSWWCGNDPLTSWWLFSKVENIPWKQVGIIPTAMVIYMVVRDIHLTCAYTAMSYLFKVEGEVRKIGRNCCYLSYKNRMMVMIRFCSYRRRKVIGKHFNNKKLAPA